MKPKNKTNKINSSEVDMGAIFIYSLFALICLLPQFFRGGYFESAYIPFAVAIGALALIYIFLSRKDRVSYVDDESILLLMMVTLLYGLSFFGAWDKRGALLEFIKHIGFLSVYIISLRLHREKVGRRWTIDLVLLAGTLVSLIGIGTILGFNEYPGSFVGGRLSSTFQYPNTLAVYVVSMYFLSLGSSLVEKKAIKNMIYGGISFIFLSSLILTSSRGMWVLFVPLALLYFIIMKGSRKGELFFSLLSTIAISLPISFLFMRDLPRLEEMGPTRLMGIYLVGIILNALALVLVARFREKMEALDLKKIYALIVAIGLVSVATGFFLFSQTEPIAFENRGDTDSTSRLIRNVSNVYPNNEYILNIRGQASREEESDFAGRIVIFSVDDEGRNTHIGTFPIEAIGGFDEDFELNTLENTSGLMFYFENIRANTSIVYEAARLEDQISQASQDIALKYKYIPENIIRRISSIDSSDSSFQARVIFAKDAVSLAGKSFFMGTGGNGWAVGYREVQSYPYWSNQVHNHYLQMFVEVGILGLLLFLGLFIVILLKYISLKKEGEDTGDIVVADALFISIFAIMAHAFMDFDLSLTGLYIIVWLLLGALASILSKGEASLGFFGDRLRIKNTRPLNYLYYVLVIIGLALAASIYLGSIYVNDAIENQYTVETEETISKLERAVAFDPYNFEYRKNLGSLYFYQYDQTKDPNYGSLAKDNTDKIYAMGKRDPIKLVHVGQDYFRFGMIDEGLDLIHEALERQPMVRDMYLLNINTALDLFNRNLNQMNLYEAQELARERGNSIRDLLLESSERALRPMPRNSNMIYRLSTLNYYGERFPEFINYYESGYRLDLYYGFDMDLDGDGSVEALGLWNRPEGRLEYTMEDFGLRIENHGEDYGVLTSGEFDLSPNSSYRIILRARGSLGDERVNLEVRDSNLENHLIDSLMLNNLGEDWKEYIIEFESPEDVGENTARFRFIFRPEEGSYLDIEEIKILRR